jgi:hypothetical protein
MPLPRKVVVAPQLDYGGFDARFPGITLRIGNPRAGWALDFWQEQIRAGVNLAPRIPNEVLDLDAALEEICLVSVLPHELRHFHDFLLSPFSTYVFQRRMMTALHGLQVYAYLYLMRDKQRAINCVPVPLQSWMKLDPEERAEVLSSLGTGPTGGAWHPPPLPTLEGQTADFPEGLSVLASENFPDALRRLALAILHIIGQIESHVASYPRPSVLRSWQVFELSAVLVQFIYVLDQLGPGIAQLLIGQLISTQGPYGEVLRVAMRPWLAIDRIFETQVASAMTFWAVCGDVWGNDPRELPAHRFQVLWEHLCENGPPYWTDDPESLIDSWSETLRVAGVEKALVRDLDMYEWFQGEFERTLEKVTSHYPVLNPEHLLEVVVGVGKAKRHAVAAYLEAPGRYIHPAFYSESIDDLPFPTVRYVLDPYALAMRSEQLERQGLRMTTGYGVKDGLLAAQVLHSRVTGERLQFWTPEAAETVSTAMLITDALFSDHDGFRTSIELKVAREFLWEQDLRLMEVLC